MSEYAISVEHIAKLYRLGEIGTTTISNDINRVWHKIRGKEDPYTKIGAVNDREVEGDSRFIWALQDIDFKVRHGEVMGVIGKNGAGKSTLLKILSKVTGPTKGRITMNGRVASLLEVGTGFHPELTGRENVYLNGAILGMTRTETKSKLDEIVDFSGVERYLDTPVKRYSSGMKVRLGFAVAAHLEPDILIVDEVLAVGDAEFQKKAVSKMQDVSDSGGRTVLFVSHNMTSVSNLCDRSILLDKGLLTMNGPTEEVVEAYLADNLNNTASQSIIPNNIPRQGMQDLMFREIYVRAVGEDVESVVYTGSDTKVSLVIENCTNTPTKNVLLGFRIDDSAEMRVAFFSNEVIQEDVKLKPGRNTVDFIIRNLSLNAGSYFITLYISEQKKVQDWVQKAYQFEVVNTDFYGTGINIDRKQGSVLFNYKIETAGV